MPKQTTKQPRVLQPPGPGRSTSEIAFNELRTEVARRNEEAHQAARKRRAASERASVLARRAADL